MRKMTPIERVELKAMQATTRDGISELLFGSILLFFGFLFYFATPIAALGVLFPLVLNPLGKFLKRRFVYPRIGYAKTARQSHDLRGVGLAALAFFSFILATFGIFILILGFEYGYSLWLSHFVPAIAGLFMAIGPWVIARTYKLMRWYIFAILFILTGIYLPLTHVAFGYTAVALESAVVGVLALVYGLGLFAMFLRKYPHVEDAHVAES